MGESTSLAGTADAIRYLCNSVFRQHLKPCDNVKFPGTMVVSLARADIDRHLGGWTPVHQKYEKAHLLAWLQPNMLIIPPTRFQALHTYGADAPPRSVATHHSCAATGPSAGGSKAPLPLEPGCAAAAAVAGLTSEGDGT